MFVCSIGRRRTAASLRASISSQHVLRRWSHWLVQSGSLQADPLCFGLLANYFPAFGADFLDHVIDPVEQYVMFVYFHPLLVFDRLGEP